MAIRFQRFRSPAGFTAIELVVAITIVCLLVAVALASFQDHMTRKARTQARSALVEVAENTNTTISWRCTARAEDAAAAPFVDVSLQLEPARFSLVFSDGEEWSWSR